MELESYDLVSSLHALPETDPIEVDGIQFNATCQSQCVALSVDVLQTACVVVVTCG